MSTLKLTKIGSKPREWQSKFGTMYDFTVQGELDGEPDTLTITSKSNPPRFKEGESLEGTVETNDFGTKFKITPSAGFAGGQRSFGKSPEEMMSIARQSSLKAAIDFFAGLVPEKPDTDAVIMVAEKFAQYVTGNYMPKPAQGGRRTAKQTADEIDIDSIELEGEEHE